MNYYYPSSGPLPVAEKPGVYAHPALGAATIDPRALGPAAVPGSQVPGSLGYAHQGSPTPSQQLAAQQAYSAAQQVYAPQMTYGGPPAPSVSSPYHYGSPHASLYQPSGLPYHVPSLASPSSPYLSSQTPTMGAVRVPVATTAAAAYQTTASPMFGYSGFGGPPMYAPSMYGASVMSPQQASAGLYPAPVGISPGPGYPVAPASAMYSSRPRPSN